MCIPHGAMRTTDSGFVKEKKGSFFDDLFS